MSDTSRSPAEGPTPVTIFGRTDRLRGDGDTEYLRQLAELVDAKMREVEAATGTADTTKIAILASLNLADDYLKASRHARPSGSSVPDEECERTVRDLVTLLDEALAEGRQPSAGFGAMASGVCGRQGAYYLRGP